MYYYVKLVNGNMDRYIGHDNQIVWYVENARPFRADELWSGQMQFLSVHPSHTLQVCDLLDIDDLCSI